MKITNVEVLVLKSPGLYNNPEGSEEPLGPTYMGIVRVTTDAGITGYSDMETAASVASSVGVKPAPWSWKASAIVKQPAWAAAIRRGLRWPS